MRSHPIAGFSMKRIACLLLAGFLSFAAFADDDKDKNHPHHEDLTETQLGTVHFPVSCTASAQKPFARGVALLHSFWYEEAEKEFVQISKEDTHCAMAHWGVAMSIWHQLWNEPDPRPKAYSAAKKKVYESYPDDHEAATFYALSLLASEPHHDETFANRKQAAAILEKLFAIEPDHPGVAH